VSFQRVLFQVLSWSVPLLGWWEGEGIRACGGFFGPVRCAVGVDEDGVAYLLNDGASAGGLRCPARDAVNQARRGCDRLKLRVGEDPERVFGAGFAGVLRSLIQSMAAKTTSG